MDDKKKAEIELYYKKKGDYNKKLQQRKEKIMVRNISIQEKKRLIQRIKMPCIFCKRNVNTFFERKNEQLTALCGGKEDKCEGKMEIKDISYSLYPEMIASFDESVTLNKEKILQLKYQTLFGYLSREKSSEEFGKLLNDFNEDTGLLIGMLRNYNDIKDQRETNEILQEELLKSRSIIESISTNMKQYHEKQEQIFLKEAMEIMIETLIPLMKKIYELKFAYKGLRKVQDEDLMKGKQTIYYLETRPYLFEAEEFYIGLEKQDSSD